ncbi:MAG: hypothetical protein JWN03_2882 [Nocardia sp.]|uniref:hypothetical protein n=1 Tax=Nocardia sp. TaxID=1821 RepID=UPI0026150B03|nr:hypothetical protein [Nocardia sp.]MCU1642607.1 hypothetical protein [Nocardia sp.]
MTDIEPFDIPDAPGDDVVAIPEDEHVTQANAAKLKAVYDKCVQKGKDRAAKMDAVARAAGARTEAHIKTLADRRALFEKFYGSAMQDWPKSATGRVMRTTWTAATKDSFEYLATPIPDEGAILLWNAEREDGEKLSNSDILFHQYRLAASDEATDKDVTDYVLPLMNYMWTENAGAGEAIELYQYMIQLNPARDNTVAVGPRVSGSPDYYALLGATNGSAPTYLVLDHCMDLGIAGISQIEVGPLTDMTYRFTRS